MKKIFFLASIAFANVLFAVQLPEDFELNATAARMSFMRAETDNEKALVLVMPGFNVKPSKLNFLLEAFAQKGIPGLLLKFSGCAEGEQCQAMTLENWYQDAGKAILFALTQAENLDRDVIIVGHSMGGLYALKLLEELERETGFATKLKRVKLALIAPADGLKPIRSIVREVAPQAVGFLESDDNAELIRKLESNPFSIMITMFPLGQLICGNNAAQNNLPLSAFKALVTPCQALVYPNSVDAQVFFYDNDGLMDAKHFYKYGTIFPKCTVHSLGMAENNIVAHTFEHLIGTPELDNLLIDPILAMLSSQGEGENIGAPVPESLD